MLKKQILHHIETNFSNTTDLETEFRRHPEYSLLQLDNIIPQQIATQMSKEIDKIPLEDCKKFTRKGSCMYEHNKLDDTPVADQVVHALHSKTFIDWLQKVTDTVDLIPDPHLVGAGYMRSFQGDSLQVHTDFNWNNELRLHRMVNLIIYLNDDWKKEWGGNLQFYDTENNKLLSEVVPSLGNAVIWMYNNLAYHGYPEPMTCPKNKSRKGIRLFYYVSNAAYDAENPPHRSLYWFDKNEKKPYDILWKR